jgi:hypothetical protein
MHHDQRSGLGKGICLELDDFKVKDLTTVRSSKVLAPLRLQILLVTCGLGFTVLGGSVMVEQVMRRIKGLPGSSHEARVENGMPGGGEELTPSSSRLAA